MKPLPIFTVIAAFIAVAVIWLMLDQLMFRENNGQVILQVSRDSARIILAAALVAVLALGATIGGWIFAKLLNSPPRP